MEKGSILKDAMILTIITLVSGLALGFVYELTKSNIEAANQAAVQAAYEEVFPDAESFKDVEDFDSEAVSEEIHDVKTEDPTVDFTDVDIDNVSTAESSDGKVLGYVITTTSHAGYGGDLTMSIGITIEGNVNGYSITTINETPGLGMKALEDDYKDQFNDIPVGSYEVTKGDAGEEEIEAISGATITSRATTNSVDAAMSYFSSDLAENQ